MRATINIFFILSFLIQSCKAQTTNSIPTVLTGASQINEYLPLIKGKHVGIVANQTSVIGENHLVDTLLSLQVKIEAIFAPEHGFRGDAGAGEDIKSGIDFKTSLKVISLYGAHNKPTSSDLENIEIVIFDIQDVGARFYTYISTLQYVMESCAENKVKLIVLDRPNPHSSYIDGPVLNKKYKSFVGMQSVPIVYAMTIGEYARFLNGEKLLKDSLMCDLKIIPLKNWDHSIKYVLPIKPSPNLPNQIAVNLYPSLCLFEGTKISLGRGTLKPFQLLGYPNNKMGNYLFKPKTIIGMALNPPYDGIDCSGINLEVIGQQVPTNINLSYLIEMYKGFPDKNEFFNDFFEKLAGTDKLRQQIISDVSEKEIRNSWESDILLFKKIRKKYLLYKDFE